MKPDKTYPRLAISGLRAAMEDSPVVLIHGPRQCGKTTLSRIVGDEQGIDYLTMDDEPVRAAAESDPVGFVEDLPARVILDEIQRVPGLFATLKSAVDRDRRPGRFLLTGSANVLLLPQLADSLAGRMEVLRLHPLAQCELESRASTFLGALFGVDRDWPHGERLGLQLAHRVVAGGYPAALTRATHARRARWYRDYVETMIQRDVRSLARIKSLDALPRLLGLAASQTARTLNAAELAGPFELTRPTIRDYLTLLERVFLLEHLAPWHSNRLSRLTKRPKLHLGDTGVAAALLGLDAEALYADRETYGQLLETFVLSELRRLATGHDDELRFHHFRDRDGYEVDIVIEGPGRRIAGVEVKASSTVRKEDFRGLRKLARACGERFAGGVVLYDGERALPFGEGLRAVPVGALWQGQSDPCGSREGGERMR